MNLGNNKQNNFAVEFISLNYSIMYLSFLFLNLSTNVSRSLSEFVLSFNGYSHNSLGSILTSEPDRGVLIKFIYEKLLSTEAVEAGMIFIK
jgi:Cdc6-like AAA superfamily ATPase